MDTELSYFPNECVNDACNSFVAEDEWNAGMTVAAVVEATGNLTINFEIETTGITDAYATMTEVEMECFDLTAVGANECDGCMEKMTGTINFDPRHLATLCPNALIEEDSDFTIQLHAVVATGHDDDDGDFFQMVRARFCVSIDVDIDFNAILDIAVEEVPIVDTGDAIDLAVAMEAVEVVVSEAVPCNITDPMPENFDFPMNERVCIHVYPTGDNAAEYFAWTEEAAISPNGRGISFSLFEDRDYELSTATTKSIEYTRPGTWTPLKPTVLDGDTTNDYFTFWLPVDLLNGQESGDARISITVAFVERDLLLSGGGGDDDG